MSGKDILIVLGMIAPSFIVIAAMAYSLAPTEQLTARGEQIAQTSKAYVEPRVATQKRMRDPWSREAPEKYSRAGDSAR